MSRFRFRIGSLLVLIVFLGVGFAALREADELWDSIVLTSAIGLLLASVLLAIHREDERRAFWVAFALFGWGYLGLTAIPSIEPRLMTTKGLGYLDSQLPGRPVLLSAQAWVKTTNNSGQVVSKVVVSPQGTFVASTPNSGGVRLWNASTGALLGVTGGTTENFVRIGQSLFALILAWLGGKLSRHLHVRSRESNRASPLFEAPGIG